MPKSKPQGSTSLSSQKSEEIRDIIERMPSRFGLVVTIVVLSLAGTLVLFGWLVEYPDTVSGQIVITARYSPVKLVANTSSNIRLLNYASKDTVAAGSYIAVLQNSASTDAVQQAKKLLEAFDVNQKHLAGKTELFPDTLSMGELNGKYYGFLSALKTLGNYQSGNVTRQQEIGLKQYLTEQNTLLQQNYAQKEYRKRKLDLTLKALGRDSSLFNASVIAEAEYERSRLNTITAREAYQEILKEISLNVQQINESENQLAQLDLQQELDERQMRLELISAYNDLQDNIASWEQEYVFISPIDGQIEYLKFWKDNQFIQSGEAVFSVVPRQNQIVGHVELPSRGAGKVQKGQKVIVKLDNYPYIEFGSIKGIVQSISLIANTVSTSEGSTSDNYLVTVGLPDKLETNYGSGLEFSYELKGTADIVTKDRKLLQRLFDNLKYSLEN